MTDIRERHSLWLAADWTLVAVMLLTAITQPAGASVFDVVTVVCQPDWYCTNLSQGECGTRTCVDGQLCGNNYNKPDEEIACPTSSSESGVHGGAGSGIRGLFFSSSSNTGAIAAEPPGEFTTDKDTISVALAVDQVRTEKVVINPSSKDSFEARIVFPASYSQDKHFITTSVASLGRYTSPTVTSIFNTTNIEPNFYWMDLEISNHLKSRNVNLLVSVYDKNNLDFDVDIKKLNFAGKGASMTPSIVPHFANTGEQVNISYVIMDSNGVVVQTYEATINDYANIGSLPPITLPENLTSGYYTLGVAVSSLNLKGKRYVPFVVLSGSEYQKVEESPTAYSFARDSEILQILAIGIVIFLLAVLIVVSGYKHRKQANIIELHMLGIRKWVYMGIISRAAEREIRLIKDSLNQGFIKEEEYEDMLLKLTSESEKPAAKGKVKKAAKQEAREEAMNPRVAMGVEAPKPHQAEAGAPREAFLKKAHGNEAFFTRAGHALSTINDLIDILDEIPDDVFLHHVTETRNDFSNWIRYVFKDAELADEIQKVKTPAELKAILEKHKQVERKTF